MANLTDKLIGDDGLVFTGDLGAELNGDGAAALSSLDGNFSTTYPNFYEITAVAGSSAFSAGLAVGDTIYDDGTIVLAVGDDVKPYPKTPDCTISGWTTAPTKDEIEVTTFCDTNKTYRTGKADLAGTLTGRVSANSLTLSNKFFDTITEVLSADNATVSRVNNTGVYVILFASNIAGATPVSNEALLVVAGKTALSSFNFDVSLGSAQEFTANYKPFSGSKLQIIKVTAS